MKKLETSYYCNLCCGTFGKSLLNFIGDREGTNTHLCNNCLNKIVDASKSFWPENCTQCDKERNLHTKTTPLCTYCGPVKVGGR